MKILNRISILMLVSICSLFILSCEKVNPEMGLVFDSITENEISQLKSEQINSSNEIKYLLNLIATIESMVDEGLLSKGNGNALKVKVENAIKHLSRLNINPVNVKKSASEDEVAASGGNENTNAALGSLNAFINQVEDFVDNGIITEVQGESLIKIADYTVHSITGDPIIADGLIAYYPLNASTIDGSGNNKHGESVNIDYSTDRVDELSSAAYFSGDGYIRVPAIGQNNSSFSIALWYKTEQSGPVLATDNIYLGPTIFDTYELFQAVWNISGATYGTTNPGYFDNTWHHVVITHNSEDSRIITYFDGIVRHNRPNTPNFLGNNVDIYLGRYIEEEHMRYGDEPYFVGAIDDVYFFNRTISSSEVDQLVYYPK